MGKSKSILFLNEGRYVWVAFALLAIHYHIYCEILDNKYPWDIFKIEPNYIGPFRNTGIKIHFCVYLILSSLFQKNNTQYSMSWLLSSVETLSSITNKL